MNYYVAFTESNGHKYGCCFNEFKRIEKWLNVVSSNLNSIRIGGLSYDFQQELRDNFSVKVFEYRESAIEFLNDYLEIKY